MVRRLLLRRTAGSITTGDELKLIFGFRKRVSCLRTCGKGGADVLSAPPLCFFVIVLPPQMKEEVSMRSSVAALLVLLLFSSTLAADEFDDCDANFIAAIGSSAYQFSPAHGGDLGTVRLFAILSYQRAAHEKRFGSALWQLRIDRAEDGTRVLTVDGRSFIGSEG